MKKLLLTLLFAGAAFAQDGFKSNNGNLVWERTFQANNANIVALLEKEPNLKVGTFMDNVFKGSGNEIKNTCDGGSGLMKNNCKFDFLIIVNPDSYTVKVTNLKFLEKYGPMQTRIMANPCEKYYVYNGAVKSDDKTKGDFDCLNNYLSSVFSADPITSTGNALTSN